MELKAYLSILWRRWYIIVLVPLVVLAGVLYQSRNISLTYTAQARVSIVRSAVEPGQNQYFQYDGYYQYLASEYALDDLVQVVQGNVFASDVSAEIKKDSGADVSADEVQGSIQSSRVNRILTISVTSSSADRAVLIASEAAKTLESNGTSYFKTTPAVSASIQTIQKPLSASVNSNKRNLLYLLQIAVAL
ncbi:MAG TPA: Wzz/FepE/Etk N-terminal domain-containing protein, partial [Nitrolancea sp.]|nr:Wzz/FepE/Etk N-terminal domain-containing protein [Nitrolancea sp.]